MTGRYVWTEARIARLGLLVGQGKSINEIASDEGISSTPEAVYKQAQRLGLSFRTTGYLLIALSEAANASMGQAARRRNISIGELVKRLLETCSCEPALVSNVLDDGM